MTEDVYRAYYKMRRREKTLAEKDARNRLAHYDAWDDTELRGSDAITDRGAPTPEEIVIAEITRDKLYRSLALLPNSERELIHALFFKGIKLSALSKQLGIPYRTLGCRRDRILEKLRKMME